MMESQEEEDCGAPAKHHRSHSMAATTVHSTFHQQRPQVPDSSSKYPAAPARSDSCGIPGANILFRSIRVCRSMAGVVLQGAMSDGTGGVPWSPGL